MTLAGLARGYTAFVLVPAVLAGLVAAVFVAGLGATPLYSAFSFVRMSLESSFFGFLVTVPVVVIARWRGVLPGPGGMAASGALLGAVFAVVAANFWLASAGSPAGSRVSVSTVWFTVLAFGIPVGVFSGLCAWNMTAGRKDR